MRLVVSLVTRLREGFVGVLKSARARPARRARTEGLVRPKRSWRPLPPLKKLQPNKSRFRRRSVEHRAHHERPLRRGVAGPGLQQDCAARRRVREPLRFGRRGIRRGLFRSGRGRLARPSEAKSGSQTGFIGASVTNGRPRSQRWRQGARHVDSREGRLPSYLLVWRFAIGP